MRRPHPLRPERWTGVDGEPPSQSDRWDPPPPPPPSLPPLQDMHGELSEQQPRVERLQGAAAAAHDQLGALSREAQRV